jgi:hypothetical protein
MLHAIHNESSTMFTSVGHALAVAILVISTEARQDSTMRAALLGMMEAVPRLTSAQADWYDELRGGASSTIDFSGLSSEDIRAQCALIVSAVQSKLLVQEMWAMQAKHACTEFETVDGRKRYAFSAVRINAIKELSDWLLPSFPKVSPAAMDCLVAKVYADHSKTKISYRDLESSFGLARMTFSRVATQINARLRGLEKDAAEKLTPYFLESGLIPEAKEIV